MSETVGILNIGLAGNIHSIERALVAAKAQTKIVSSVAELSQVDRLVLPGVGAFAPVMGNLNEAGLIDAVKGLKIPVLGICLGMQILADKGFEEGETVGLELIPSEVNKIECDAVLPHVGFNKLKIVQEFSLLEEVEEEPFYFMHSYEMGNGPFVTAFTQYEDRRLVAAVKENNFYGVQFHPEKSRLAGIKVFENFLKV